jgi:hypothetical protein
LKEKRLLVREDILRKLDAEENESMPDVEVMPSELVEFGPVEYEVKQVRSIEIKNISSVSLGNLHRLRRLFSFR